MARNISAEDFKNEIFDYSTEKEWRYKGNKPAIIDFYADWCAPCKMVAPILDDLSEEYDGKVDILKVNTEVEMELSTVFGIRSIPSILFIPMDGQPMMHAGALPYQGFKEAIEKELLGNSELVQ